MKGICFLFFFQKRAKAQHLLDKVFGHLELVEKDYFGLQFIDIAPPSEAGPHGHVQGTSYAMVCTIYAFS